MIISHQLKKLFLSSYRVGLLQRILSVFDYIKKDWFILYFSGAQFTWYWILHWQMCAAWEKDWDGDECVGTWSPQTNTFGRMKGYRLGRRRNRAVVQSQYHHKGLGWFLWGLRSWDCPAKLFSIRREGRALKLQYQHPISDKCCFHWLHPLLPFPAFL